MWRKSTSSIDWTDVRNAMRELDQTYTVHTTMMLSPVGPYAGVAILVTLAASWMDVGAVGNTGTASVTRRWPNSEGQSMEAVALALAYEMERHLMGKRLFQSEFT